MELSVFDNEYETDGFEEKLYNSFEDAYNAYADLYNLINDSVDKLERIKRKAKIKDIKTTISLWAGIIGAAFGLVGIVVALIAS